MEGDCRRAKKILDHFCPPNQYHGLDGIIPPSIMKGAKGFAIFTVVRAGFMMSVRVGMGIVVARLPSGKWSAPSAIGVGGFGGGFNAGAELVDFLIVLNTTSAVRTFMASGSLQLGGNLSVAVGPLGRTGEAGASINGDMQLAAMFTYCVSRGLYGGVTIEGTLLGDRPDANTRTYNRPCTASEILSGKVDVPDFALPLITRLEEITGTEPFAPSMFYEPEEATDYSTIPTCRPEKRRRPPPPGTQVSPSVRSLEEEGGPFSPPPYSTIPKGPDTSYSSSSLKSIGKGYSRANEVESEDPFSDFRSTQYDPNLLSYEPRTKHRSYQNAPPSTSASKQSPVRGSQAYGLDESFNADFDFPASAAPQTHSSGAPASSLVESGVLDGDLVVAIHDFTAQRPSDLTFHRGDIVRVTHRTNKSNDWWTGELVAQFSEGPSHVGQFPSNYTEPL